MDSVPSVFRERVAALWKCCDRFFCERTICHIHRRIPDCEWTRISRKRQINFYVGIENGKLIYGFGDPEETGADRILTMAELKKFPGLKNVLICRMDVFDKSMNHDVVSNLRPLDVDMEVLVKFVLFLSNEPHLHVGCISPESLASPEGSTLFNWLQEMHFSRVYFDHYEANYHRLLERQYSKRTRIDVFNIESGKEFLEAELSAVRLRKCQIFESLSPYVLNAIVLCFLGDPSLFGNDYEVTCFFKSEETTKILREMKKTTRFIREYAKMNTGNYEFAVEGSNGKVLTIRQFGVTCTMSV